MTTSDKTPEEAPFDALFADRPLPGAPDALMARLGLAEIPVPAPAPVRRNAVPRGWSIGGGLVAAAIMAVVGLNPPATESPIAAGSPTPAFQEAAAPASDDALLNWFGPTDIAPVDPLGSY